MALPFVAVFGFMWEQSGFVLAALAILGAWLVFG